MSAPVDASAILRPGVYTLSRNGRVVYVGRGKSMLARIHSHAAQYRGSASPAWLPAKPIIFDEVALFPCRIDQLDATYSRVCADVGWAGEASPVSPPILLTQRRA